MISSRVAAPNPPRPWWIVAATASATFWLATAAANAYTWSDHHAAVAPQINAFGVATAACLVVLAGMLYVLRRLRQGQRELCGAVEVNTAVSEEMRTMCGQLLTAMNSNTATVGENTRAMSEVCLSYAETVQALYDGKDITQLRQVSGARPRGLN